MQDVTGKVAFITGGASGMGLAMARSFSAAGMKVAIADVQKDALAKVEAEFRESNADVTTLEVDVTDRDAMARAADATCEAFGKVHVVCNNAGVAVGGSLANMSYHDWDWVMGVNLDGVINGLQTFLPRILEHGEGGHVVNTASMAGHMAIPGLGVYNATKYAVVGISETLRADLASANVGVSVLCPGVVGTNIFDSERNRPAELKPAGYQARPLSIGADAAAPADDQDEAQRARMQAIMAAALEPGVVGDMVLHAILNDDLYIFTHPELQPMVDERQSAITDAFARWRDYRIDNNV